MERSFAPSQYHKAALARITPSHGWVGGPFSEWQADLRRAFKAAMGWNDDAVRVPLDVETVEIEECSAYTRRKLVFTSEPGADVPCHLLVPRGLEGPVPAFVCLQGHTTGMHISLGVAKHPGDENAIASGDRDFALQAVREGYVALVMEQRSFGERAETLQLQRAQNGCEDAAMHALLLGRPIACERAWDVSRAIDLLLTIPEVRPDRIGCMGNSGGGSTTFYAACLDDRIWLAMPSCSFCTYKESIFRIYHCPDNFIPGILKIAEVGDLAGLIAPRNLVVVAGKEDDIFPIKGVKRAFAHAASIYEAAGARDNITLEIGDGGHRFYAALGWPAVKRFLAE
jgi:hypothetical protein